MYIFTFLKVLSDSLKMVGGRGRNNQLC